ncbi:transglycosylase, putative [Roseobacter sp. SK209-2-6]|uniref:lytic murein transglycosylase n=1 Tax=Roseobacter sp. SK209-2-6 TaxID=388739 RepID=UPI0000F3C24A|nr:lytic murein transglycosylase [Roseobacter sp. SK209-2-6]EBA15365.1 transglycosylase, putative [Roseobacter sp. SK209-2-6]
MKQGASVGGDCDCFGGSSLFLCRLFYRPAWLLVFLVATFSVAPASAANRAKIERQFQTWLKQVIWPQAQAAGVSQQTFRAAFKGVTLNWELPDLSPPGSKPSVPKRQRQAEFSAPAKYFSRGSLDGTTAQGKRMAQQHRTALRRAEQATGVPGRILLAIWGRESAFGRAKIPHNAFQVLGTKGFMGRRAEYFTEELLAALQIADAGHVSPGAMKSSWAGALGQPQFMPGNFLKFARDGNGDGRADIWKSEADTLMSIAHFLAQHGWQKSRDWGFEVKLPATVSCTLEGPDQGRPISDWEAMGIKRVSNRPFPAHERAGEGFLMMPAGRNGPAFLVTPNFYVLKDYNKSDLYALYVGHAGDRIDFGSGDFTQGWTPVDRLLRSDVAKMQETLERLGHDVGGADGLVGFKTRRSIGRWQQANGQEASCFPDARLVKRLQR